MKWELVAYLQWRAIGSKGDFFVWKDGQFWKGRYTSKNRQHTAVFEKSKTLWGMQSTCEDSVYWE